MDLLKRHFSLTLLVTVLFLQVLGLAVQVKRPTEHGAVPLARLWGVSLVTPVEHAVEHSQNWLHSVWHDYFYLREVRRENERLNAENMRLRLEQVRMVQDASQAQRLQALLKFKEEFISETVAAQVIGSSGTEQSRVIYIDKGERDGIKADMAVITPAGIVGKVWHVFPNNAQVLEINDQSSGVGAILEKSRLQGILKGVPAGDALPMLHYIMNEEKVEPGEMVLTSGGDRIFPKGLPIGHVAQVNPGPETFMNIRVLPAARLNRLEEVLIITKVVDKEPENLPGGPMRASEILAQRLPTVPPKPPEPEKPGAAAAPAGGASPAGAGTTAAQKPATASVAAKPAGTPVPKPNPNAPPKPALPSNSPADVKPAGQAGPKPSLAPATATAPKQNVTKIISDAAPKLKKPVAQNQAETPKAGPQ